MNEFPDSTHDVIRGEFFTDGKTFIFKLGNTPLSGTGNSPEAAFQDLMRVEAEAGGLGQRLKDLATEQAGERVRVALIRWSVIALIVFGVAGGALVGAIALTPAVVEAVNDSTAARLLNLPGPVKRGTAAKLYDLLNPRPPAGGRAPAAPPSPDKGSGESAE